MPTPFRLRGALIAALSLSCWTLQAQTLQSPADFLGYELGSRFTPHHRVVDYYEHVAETSDKVMLYQYGETYEGRPLLAAYVGTPERLGNLEQVRLGNLSRAGLANVEPTDAAIVWLSYNVHGNEAVSTEASLATIYELVRPGNERAEGWLENVLVVIDPCVNPDGRDRYVIGYNQRVGARPNPDSSAREHREPWPGGRTNHYNFDLNRDWAWQTQKESLARLKLFNAWLPQVVVDFHEQGVNSPYYFAPAAEPYHDAISDWQRVFQDSIGTNHARYFDAKGWLYFTREVFDLFYPGYGDTYPVFNGAIGMTYEQGGGGRAGLAIETAEADTLTLGDRIAHHYTTGLSTVEVTAHNARRVLAEFGSFYTEAAENPGGPWRTYVMKASSGRDRIEALAAHLDRLGIEYGTVQSDSKRVQGHDYRTATSADQRAQPGDLVVSAYQPKGVLARVLLEPDPPLPDSLTYDITAWALPYAYGLDAFATTERIEADQKWTAQVTPPMEAGSPYAYMLRWDSPKTVVFLAGVLAAGVTGRIADAPFVMGGETFDAGTLLFTRTGNEALGARFDRILTKHATAQRVALVTTGTGRVDSGSDFGSNRVRYLKAPKVVVVTGTPISSSAAGEVWHWFEQELEYPVTMVNAADLRSLDLSETDVLILPNGSYGSVLTNGFMDDLRSWIRDGGRLVAMERAVAALEGKDGFDIKKRDNKDEDEDEDAEAEDALRPYADRVREGLTERVAGAVFRTRVDATHPLGFGMESGYYTLRRTNSEYEYLKDGWNVGVLESEGRLSGHIGSDAREKVEDVLAFAVQEMGRGSVAYLIDNPIYRGFWYDGRLLLGNAVFMSGR
ncbi:zinc carboxypeptidase [Rhodothermus sp. AH-315-K08]|nr:zinc carboxypeptidase [Rhodothermus sp. AH-315-K08]